jgi:membrane protease YdiL (CAAX protease family)
MRERWKQAGLILLSLVAVVAAMAAYPFLMTATANQSFHVGHIGLAIVCLVAYLAAARLIERRAPTELSLRHALPALGAGLLVGVALFALVMAVLWIAGAYRPQGWNSVEGLGLAAMFWLAVGVREEIFYRGLLFRLCSRVVGTWGALLLSAAIFAAMHLASPGWTLAGLVSIVVAGVMFAAAYAATGRLWLPIGLHTGWNFTQGSVFGLLVSGNDTGSGLIAGTLQGPDVLTGGPFGPEATIVTVIVIGATAAYLLWRMVKLRRVEPPIWSGVKGTAEAVPV